jgi:hypothetical protein
MSFPIGMWTSNESLLVLGPCRQMDMAKRHAQVSIALPHKTSYAITGLAVHVGQQAKKNVF